MISCTVFGCNNSTEIIPDQTVQYYYFPKHPVLAEQWLNACLWKEEFDSHSARICSIHFTPDSYTSDYIMLDYNGTYTKMLKHDAVPTLHLSHLTNIAKPIPPTHSDYIYDPTTNHTIANLSTPNYGVKLEPLSIFQEEEIIDDKYKNIDIQQVHQDNIDLKVEIESRMDALNKLRTNYNDACNLYRNMCISYKQKSNMRNKLKRQTINTADQLNLLKKVFSESQIKILTGKKKIYWSNDDMAVAYTIRHMSSKRCYTYLMKNLNIPLPGLSSIKRWVTLKKGESSKSGNKGNEMVKLEDSD